MHTPFARHVGPFHVVTSAGRVRDTPADSRTRSMSRPRDGRQVHRFDANAGEAYGCACFWLRCHAHASESASRTRSIDRPSRLQRDSDDEGGRLSQKKRVLPGGWGGPERVLLPRPSRWHLPIDDGPTTTIFRAKRATPTTPLRPQCCTFLHTSALVRPRKQRKTRYLLGFLTYRGPARN